MLFERFRDLSSYFRLGRKVKSAFVAVHNHMTPTGDLTAEIYYERVADQLGADVRWHMYANSIQAL